MNFYYKHIYTQSFICTPVNISKCSIQAKIDMIKFLTDLDNKRFGILFNLSCYWSGSSFPYDFLYLIDQSFLHLFEWLQTNRQICCLTDTFIILKQSSYIHWFFYPLSPLPTAWFFSQRNLSIKQTPQHCTKSENRPVPRRKWKKNLYCLQISCIAKKSKYSWGLNSLVKKTLW